MLSDEEQRAQDNALFSELVQQVKRAVNRISVLQDAKRDIDAGKITDESVMRAQG